MGKKVKDIGYEEEIAFEQMLITDNIGRPDLIIIDRQVQEKGIRTRMDLLTLKQKGNSDYQFCVIEVKLGNNPELVGKVATQLEGYVKRLEDKFDIYKKTYELNFKQKQELGLFDKSLNINIVPDILGVVVVGGYSMIAEKRITDLRAKSPDIQIIQFKNRINL